MSDLLKAILDTIPPHQPKNYKVGDIITYRNNGGELLKVKVEEREEDIKHGHPGFNGQVIGSKDPLGGVWGYDDQITNIESV